jgi:hypothetical protein
MATRSSQLAERGTTSSRRTRVRRGAIHIGAHHIRLNFVALHLLSRRGMVDPVDEVPKLHRAIASTLKAVARATQVLKDAFVEKRIEQLDHLARRGVRAPA